MSSCSRFIFIFPLPWALDLCLLWACHSTPAEPAGRYAPPVPCALGSPHPHPRPGELGEPGAWCGSSPLPWQSESSRKAGLRVEPSIFTGAEKFLRWQRLGKASWAPPALGSPLLQKRCQEMDPTPPTTYRATLDLSSLDKRGAMEQTREKPFQAAGTRGPCGRQELEQPFGCAAARPAPPQVLARMTGLAGLLLSLVTCGARQLETQTREFAPRCGQQFPPCVHK